MQRKLLSLGLAAIAVGALVGVAPQQAQAQTYFDAYGNPFYGPWSYYGNGYTSFRPRDRGVNWNRLVNRVVNRLIDDRFGYSGNYTFGGRYPYSYQYGSRYSTPSVRIGGSYWTY